MTKFYNIGDEVWFVAKSKARVIHDLGDNCYVIETQKGNKVNVTAQDLTPLPQKKREIENGNFNFIHEFINLEWDADKKTYHAYIFNKMTGKVEKTSIIDRLNEEEE